MAFAHRAHPFGVHRDARPGRSDKSRLCSAHGAIAQRQRLLVAGGFVIVAIAFGGQILDIYHDDPGIDGPDYQITFGAAYTVGYSLLAWATWVWFKWLEATPSSGGRMSSVLGLFAVANLAFAIGLTSETYFWADQAIRRPYVGRTFVAIPVTYGLQLFGFLLISVGSWSAASTLRRGTPPPDAPTGDHADPDGVHL